ncbi:AY761185 [Phodopus roborovskii]|uniref:AY761185 protein n=1 Tax=Phodopus roborovskii TaxID=109678 RepID=A0AAU9Z4J7_PHORO|nr:AY761185 [Phodopus roborovskii]
MKTLFLLSALVLLAFQALADPLPEATEEAKNEAQLGIEDQEVSISFGNPEVSALHRSPTSPDIQLCCPLYGTHSQTCPTFPQSIPQLQDIWVVSTS